MSQITALLLIYMNEEDAFWALVKLLSGHKHAMHGKSRHTSVLFCFLNIILIIENLYPYSGQSHWNTNMFWHLNVQRPISAPQTSQLTKKTFVSKMKTLWLVDYLLLLAHSGQRIKRVSSSGFFVPGFPKLMRFQEHHDRILKKMIPKLKQHLVRNPAGRRLFKIRDKSEACFMLLRRSDAGCGSDSLLCNSPSGH